MRLFKTYKVYKLHACSFFDKPYRFKKNTLSTGGLKGRGLVLDGYFLSAVWWFSRVVFQFNWPTGRWDRMFL